MTQHHILSKIEIYTTHSWAEYSAAEISIGFFPEYIFVLLATAKYITALRQESCRQRVTTLRYGEEWNPISLH